MEPNTTITSLHSPHVERVKALLGSRGKKIRNTEHVFIADGVQSLRSALIPKISTAPIIEKLYLTETGQGKIRAEFAQEILDQYEVIMVSEQVMNAMAETESPQGILALCKYLPSDLSKFQGTGIKRVAFFWEIQDPGNAGTAIRTADACGFDLVLFSPNCVDAYSPKVIRSTAGSMWHIPIATDITLEVFEEFAKSNQIHIYALDGAGENELKDIDQKAPAALVFGNEARGLPQLPTSFQSVKIPMSGHAESFNVASAAAIAMYSISTGALS